MKLGHIWSQRIEINKVFTYHRVVIISLILYFYLRLNICKLIYSVYLLIWWWKYSLYKYDIDHCIYDTNSLKSAIYSFIYITWSHLLQISKPSPWCGSIEITWFLNKRVLMVNDIIGYIFHDIYVQICIVLKKKFSLNHFLNSVKCSEKLKILNT